MQAESFIAIFANEITSYKENLNKAQNTKMFEDNSNLNNLKSETKPIKNYYKKLETSGFIDTAGIEYLDSIEIQHPASEQALECIAAVGWNTSLRTAGENIQKTNEAAEKIALDDEQDQMTQMKKRKMKKAHHIRVKVMKLMMILALFLVRIFKFRKTINRRI